MKMVLLLGSFQKNIMLFIVRVCSARLTGPKKKTYLTEVSANANFFQDFKLFDILEVFMSSTHCVLTHGELQYLSWSCKAMNC